MWLYKQANLILGSEQNPDILRAKNVFWLSKQNCVTRLTQKHWTEVCNLIFNDNVRKRKPRTNWMHHEIKLQQFQWVPLPLFHQQVCLPWHQHPLSNLHEPTRTKKQRHQTNPPNMGAHHLFVRHVIWKRLTNHQFNKGNEDNRKKQKCAIFLFKFT